MSDHDVLDLPAVRPTSAQAAAARALVAAEGPRRRRRDRRRRVAAVGAPLAVLVTVMALAVGAGGRDGRRVDTGPGGPDVTSTAPPSTFPAVPSNTIPHQVVVTSGSRGTESCIEIRQGSGAGSMCGRDWRRAPGQGPSTTYSPLQSRSGTDEAPPVWLPWMEALLVVERGRADEVEVSLAGGPLIPASRLPEYRVRPVLLSGRAFDLVSFVFPGVDDDSDHPGPSPLEAEYVEHS